MPDMERQPRRRAVAVELAEFTELMGQRVEHQFGGDGAFRMFDGITGSGNSCIVQEGCPYGV